MPNWDTTIRIANNDGTVTLAFEDYLRIIGNQPFSFSATELGDKSDNVNLNDKYAGKMVWNSTANLPFFATGASNTSTWINAAGGGTITPS